MQHQLFSQIQRAIQLANSGNITGSKNVFLSILAAHPDFFEANYHYSSLMLQTGDYETALGYAQKAVELKPADIRALWLLSEVYLKSGRIHRGIDICTTMLALKRQQPPSSPGGSINPATDGTSRTPFEGYSFQSRLEGDKLPAVETLNDGRPEAAG
ncbi:MAG TPA: tetratricopeptide repeat protein [Desulfobacteraceae bacterium]|nr:tetratricopeptide repeat protein [Desulfobacteraceae bacterium]